MKLAVLYDRSDLNKIQFPIVVELWGRIKYGRGKRLFHEQFSPKERRKAYRWYKIFYNWYLVKGTPDNYVFRYDTIQFIEKLINFFGEL